MCIRDRKYGKHLITDFAQMLRVINERSVRPVQDAQEFLGRMVAFILMGNTDAHLKNWAFIYEDGIHPALAPLYDPVSVTSFFKDVRDEDYAQNRAIDRTVSAFTWDDMRSLIDEAGLLRPTVLIRHCKALVRHAQASWAATMEAYAAPPAMVQEISERLSGKVALAT